MKLAVTGTTGLVGSQFESLLSKEHQIFGINGSSGIDIRKKDLLFDKLNEITPDLILHFAAKTNVDACEEDKNNDLLKIKEMDKDPRESIIKSLEDPSWENINSAFSINVLGTKNLVDYAREKNIKLVYISTDFVFDGQKDFYSEVDLPAPINWYGATKYFGEIIVASTLKNFLIARISYPYGYKSNIKDDFIQNLIKILNEKDEISLVFDQYITPTFIEDIVLGLNFLIKNDVKNIIHLTGDSSLTPFELGKLLSKNFYPDKKTELKAIKREDYYVNRAKRPFKSNMINDKLEQLGFRTKQIEEGLEKIASSFKK